MDEERNPEILQQIGRCGTKLKPTPQELVDICKEGVENGKPLNVIRSEISAYCERNPEKVQGTGRRGGGNLTMLQHLMVSSTVPECLINDPVGCELDYMSDNEVRDYLTEMQRQTKCTTINGFAEIAKSQLENDLLYLAFKGRLMHLR